MEIIRRIMPIAGSSFNPPTLTSCRVMASSESATSSFKSPVIETVCTLGVCPKNRKTTSCSPLGNWMAYLPSSLANVPLFRSVTQIEENGINSPLLERIVPLSV